MFFQQNSRWLQRIIFSLMFMLMLSSIVHADEERQKEAVQTPPNQQFDLSASTNAQAAYPQVRAPDVCIEFTSTNYIDGFKSRAAVLGNKGGPAWKLDDGLRAVPTWDLELLKKYWPAGPRFSKVDWWPVIIRPDTAGYGYSTFDAGGNGPDQVYGPRGWIQPYNIGRRTAYKVWFDYSRLQDSPYRLYP